MSGIELVLKLNFSTPSGTEIDPEGLVCWAAQKVADRVKLGETAGTLVGEFFDPVTKEWEDHKLATWEVTTPNGRAVTNITEAFQ